MTFTAETYSEAKEIAADIVRLYGRDGYTVEIVAPLFAGDTYRVNAY